MSNYTVRKYSENDKSSWESFLGTAKNGSFLFHRDFMEYHADRFQDYSLVVLKNNKVVGLLPANRLDQSVHSHTGLSYGGLILNNKTKLNEVTEIFKSILQFLNKEGIEILSLKLLPRIYATMPSDEMDYLLFITEANLTRTDVLSVIDNQNPLKIAANRVEGVKKAQKNELTILEGIDFVPFWEEILLPNLHFRHGSKPVHTIEEITRLNKSFPENIRQFNVFNGNKIVGGATIFETETVAHVQYISADKDKQQLGTLDFLFEFLIKQRYKEKRYFDFGTSNENQGRNINEGLLYWKECFGARSIIQQFYEVKTANYKKLDSIFI